MAWLARDVQRRLRVGCVPGASCQPGRREHTQRAGARGSESVLHFCEAHDPSAAAKLQRRIEELVSGRSTTKPRELRDSDEYRKTYEAVLQFAERNDPHDVAGFCQRDGTVEH